MRNYVWEVSFRLTTRANNMALAKRKLDKLLKKHRFSVPPEAVHVETAVIQSYCGHIVRKKKVKETL